MLALADLESLRCPASRTPLRYEGPPTSGWLRSGELVSDSRRWPVIDGLPRLYEEAEVRGSDRLMRHIYDRLPFLHDTVVRLTLPLFQGTGEAPLRDAYMRRLELERLEARADGQPLRILETGIGCGANLPLLARDLPPRLPVEIWGMDLSFGMIDECRKRLRPAGRRDVRLLMADAHSLPFPDDHFDRVFHVGAIGNFRDPARALAEMARVARPGTPIVVVDEQLDPAVAGNPYRWLAFRAVTFYDRDPHCPREHLPPEAEDVLEEQIAPFFYCMRFRVP